MEEVDWVVKGEIGGGVFRYSVIALERVAIKVAYPSFPGDLKHFPPKKKEFGHKRNKNRANNPQQMSTTG